MYSQEISWLLHTLRKVFKFWPIRDNYRRAQFIIHHICYVTFMHFTDWKTWLVDITSSDVSRTRLIFFLNIYGWFKFSSQIVHRSKIFCFSVFIFYMLPLFLSRNVDASNYDRYGALFLKNACAQIEWYSVSFQNSNYFFGLCIKTLRRCLAINTLQKKND